MIYDTDAQTYIHGRYFQRPKIKVTIVSSKFQDWVYFKKHHYLSDDVSRSCHFYTAYINSKPVGFVAVIHRCGRDIKSYWAESRLVILPEFQGLGIGNKLSEAVAEIYTRRGFRYFAKTAHSSLGEYRNNNPNKWRKTSTNQICRSSYIKKDGTARKQKGYGKTEKSIYRDAIRVCYSHEYINKDIISPETPFIIDDWI